MFSSSNSPSIVIKIEKIKSRRLQRFFLLGGNVSLPYIDVWESYTSKKKLFCNYGGVEMFSSSNTSSIVIKIKKIKSRRLQRFFLLGGNVSLPYIDVWESYTSKKKLFFNYGGVEMFSSSNTSSIVIKIKKIKSRRLQRFFLLACNVFFPYIDVWESYTSKKKLFCNYGGVEMFSSSNTSSIV